MNQWWNIVNWTLWNKLQWNFDQNSCIFIQENALENGWKMLAILTQHQCVKYQSHLSNEKWQKLQKYFHVSQNKFNLIKVRKKSGLIRICLDFPDPYDPIWLIHLISMLIGWDRVFAFPPSSITVELIGWEPSIQDKPVQAYLNADWLILQCHFLCPACISLNLSFP